MLHSPANRVAGIENAAMIFDAARHSKIYVSLGNADRLPLREGEALQAGRVIAAWASYYL